jgi:hypothetical protein
LWFQWHQQNAIIDPLRQYLDGIERNPIVNLQGENVDVISL